MNGTYVIGEPGVGKSAFVRAMTAGVDYEQRRKPFAHVIYFSEDYRVIGTQLGSTESAYPGTDRLSMSVQPQAIEWIMGAPAPWVLGEGDRLATRGFLEAMDKACESWWLVLLTAPPEELARRRGVRGSHQDEAWLAGRATKVRRLVDAHGEHVVSVEAMEPVGELVRRMRDHPAFAPLNPA